MKLNNNKSIFYLYLGFVLIFVFNYFLANTTIYLLMSVVLLIISILGIRSYTTSKISDDVKDNKLLVIISSLTLVISLIWIVINILMSGIFLIFFQ